MNSSLCSEPRCANGDPRDLCAKCQLSLEELAIASALNMGIPDCFFCGGCGMKCDDALTMKSHILSCEFCINAIS